MKSLQILLTTMHPHNIHTIRLNTRLYSGKKKISVHSFKNSWYREKCLASNNTKYQGGKLFCLCFRWSNHAFRAIDRWAWRLLIRIQITQKVPLRKEICSTIVLCVPFQCELCLIATSLPRRLWLVRGRLLAELWCWFQI